MPISNYIVFGIITDKDDNPINDATVYAVNTTQSGITITDTTDANGAYRLDLSTFATIEDTNSITISCTSSHQSNSYNFTLDLAFPFRRVDLKLAYKTSPMQTDAILELMDIETTNLFDSLLLSREELLYDLDILILRQEELEQEDLDTLLLIRDLVSSNTFDISIKVVKYIIINFDDCIVQ